MPARSDGAGSLRVIGAALTLKCASLPGSLTAPAPLNPKLPFPAWLPEPQRRLLPSFRCIRFRACDARSAGTAILPRTKAPDSTRTAPRPPRTKASPLSRSPAGNLTRLAVLSFPGSAFHRHLRSLASISFCNLCARKRRALPYWHDATPGRSAFLRA